MSLDTHLAELQRKHETLKAKIAAEQNRPGGDDLELTTMKKRKLRLKEEIERWKKRAA